MMTPSDKFLKLGEKFQRQQKKMIINSKEIHHSNDGGTTKKRRNRGRHNLRHLLSGGGRMKRIENDPSNGTSSSSISLSTHTNNTFVSGASSNCSRRRDIRCGGLNSHQTTKQRKRRFNLSGSSKKNRNYDGNDHDSFSHLVTSKNLLKLEEEFDDDLDLIGNRSGGINTIQRVERSDYTKVALVGQGAYSNVYMVQKNYRNISKSRHGDADDDGKFYAYKCLDPNRINDTEKFCDAASDLAMEAKILSDLDRHENISHIVGVCSAPFSQSFSEDNNTTTDDGYFLVFEFLTEILSNKLEQWREDDDLHSSSYYTKSQVLSDQLNTNKMYERIESVALGIVSGMAYLHSKGIVIRDLKPANVGIDKNGIIRLFDFGMARKLEDCFDDTTICGSPRYMAPEVMGGEGYTYKSDVYSFGIILYELCSLSIAFGGCNNKKNKINKKKKNANVRDDDYCGYDFSNLIEFQHLLVEENKRPKLDRIGCPIVRALIADCWQSVPDNRPTFDAIYERLNDVLNNIESIQTQLQ